MLVRGTTICGATDDRSVLVGARVCSKSIKYVGVAVARTFWAVIAILYVIRCLVEASAVDQHRRVLQFSTLVVNHRQVVLDTLKFVECRLRHAAQKGVAVVEFGYSVFVFSFFVITGPPNWPVLFCSRASVVCRCRMSFVVVCNIPCGRAGQPPGVWLFGRRAGRVDGRAADTARWASTITSR